MGNENKLKILALKYRPKLFKDLIGQEVIAETILNAIRLGKTPNAYLLTGIRGVGKTTTARLIAKALNCTKNKNDNSLCDEKDSCNHCKEIENSNHIDVLEMDAASKTGIDDVRELIENSKYNPTSAKYKIFIIDEVHMLSKQAFNGLLKTLEEPPEKLKFILATTEVRKIPITILSRCQRFDLRRVGLESIKDHLSKILKIEKGKISDDAIKLLAIASEGSVRDAVSLLDRALVFQSLKPNEIIQDLDVRKMLGLADKSQLINLLKNVFEGNESGALKILRTLIDNGLDAKNFLNDILQLVYLFSRRVSLGTIEKELFLSDSEIGLIEKVSKDLNIQDLNLFWQLTLKTIEDLDIVSNENISLEMYLMQLMHIKSINEKQIDSNFLENDKSKTILDDKGTLENKTNFKSTHSAKEQLKNIEQVKTLRKNEPINELVESKQFKVKSFEDLVEIAEKNKEIELKYDLERNVKLVSFEEGKISINFNENLNKNFIKKLSQNLYDWTGKRWIISLSKAENFKTFHQEKIDKKEKILNEEKNSKASQEMLEIFNDANLIDVRTEDE
ncbi:MAG: DNA polymerase III, subunit gamma and tau [Candidatus Marinimicrobia bacterium]|nr:DNA polymerase III, subunit gamma and tau [Candidatus Neomarinimicrobiota bacterium]|tara:strand:- start:1596 stop:3281 length:1686 start_codon:yes stop_codon:yes gene_type:complete